MIYNVSLVALSRISPRIRVRVSVSIVYRIATGGYSWIWPWVLRNTQPTPHMEQQHSQITYFCEEQIV